MWLAWCNCILRVYAELGNFWGLHCWVVSLTLTWKGVSLREERIFFCQIFLLWNWKAFLVFFLACRAVVKNDRVILGSWLMTCSFSWHFFIIICSWCFEVCNNVSWQEFLRSVGYTMDLFNVTAPFTFWKIPFVVSVFLMNSFFFFCNFFSCYFLPSFPLFWSEFYIVDILWESTLDSVIISK